MKFLRFQYIDMIVDIPVVVQHQVPTIQTVRKLGEVSRSLHLDRYRHARREAETGPDQPENPEDGREDTGASPQRRVPIIQKFQKIETTQVVQRECRLSRRSRRLLRHHRNSCGRSRGSSSSRRRLSTRQVLVIQSPEDRVCPTGTAHDQLVLQHQVQTILTMQRQRRFLRASSLIVEDLPEMGQRQDSRTDRRDIFSIIQKIQKVVEVPRVVQRPSRSPRDPEDREDSTTDPARSKAQSGQSPKRPDRPDEVRGQRAQNNTEGAGLRS